MNNLLIVWLLATALLLPVRGFSQASTSEQDAIRKAIEDETAAINACDYARWADHWWPETYCYFSVTWPKGHWSMQGWEEISAWGKTATTNCTPSPNRKKEGFKYAINGNMAFVTFLEDEGNESTRVLEKRNGRWKLIRMGVIASVAYTAMERLDQLHKFAGKWEADLSTFKNDPPPNGWEITGFEFENLPTETGITLKHRRDWKDTNGAHYYLRNGEVARRSSGEEMGLFVSQSDSFGWSEYNFGSVSLSKEGVMTALTKKANSDKLDETARFTLNPDGRLNLTVEVYDDLGKVVFKFSVEMKKQ